MKGSCLCGAVRFRVTGTPTAFDLCHCLRCRAASGSAFLAELEFKTAEFEWLSGRSLVKTTRRQCAIGRLGTDAHSARYVALRCHSRSGDHSRPGWDPRRRSGSPTAASHLRRLRGSLVPNHRCSGPIRHQTQAGLVPQIVPWRGIKREIFDAAKPPKTNATSAAVQLIRAR